jgi:hypothetical protein
MVSPFKNPALGPGELPRCLSLFLALLLQAADYARRSGHSPWDFALDLAQARAVGVTDNELRYLVYEQLLEYVSATPGLPPASGAGLLGGRLLFPPETCFILSPRAVSFARLVAATQPLPEVPVPSPAAGAALLPDWDLENRQLSYAGLLVKRIPEGARNEECLLTAWHELHWPACMDDPLPGGGDVDGPERLHSTVKRLNRAQVHPLLHFGTAHAGRAAYWERRLTPGPRPST